MDGPILDIEITGWLRDLGDQSDAGRSEVRNLVLLYLREGRTRLESLTAAAHAGELETVRAVAHSLAGSSANLGAWIVARSCREIESDSIAGRATSTTTLVALAAAFDESETALCAEFVDGVE
jgi:HPt (histidine-containing phosphotransfer) domain-containing protein